MGRCTASFTGSSITTMARSGVVGVRLHPWTPEYMTIAAVSLRLQEEGGQVGREKGWDSLCICSAWACLIRFGPVRLVVQPSSRPVAQPPSRLIVLLSSRLVV